MKLLRFPIFAVLLFCSCDTLDKEESVPSFIHVESIDVIENNINCGDGHHNIKDIRVFANSNLIGLFELPATVPILESGETTISIKAGVLNLGVPTDRVDYPFTDAYTAQVNLVPDMVTEISPVVTYFDDVDEWSEAFDDLGAQFTVEQGSMTRPFDSTIVWCPYEDFRIAKLTSTDDNPIVEIVSNDPPFEANPFGNTYLEFNYKNEETFFIGIQSGPNESDKNFIAGINPSYEDSDLIWKKMHFELAPYLAQLSTAQIGAYNLIFKSELSSPESVLLIDNVRIVHR